MHQEIERIEATIETDPALAIGTAKEMVETCCKHIAEALKVELPANPDMPVLVKAVLKGLRLVPENIPESSKGAESINAPSAVCPRSPRASPSCGSCTGPGTGAPPHTAAWTPVMPGLPWRLLRRSWSSRSQPTRYAGPRWTRRPDSWGDRCWSW